MKKFFLLMLAIAFSASSAFSQACETFNDGPYINFNSQGGAPCSDPAPATNAITAFEIWKAESYLMAGVQAGATYEFSACTGIGGTAWDIDYTIVAPSGAIDAFGLDAGSICAITWTATEDGEYTIIINEAGNCGATTGLTVDNGFPQITYLGGGSCPDPVTACEAGTLDAASIPEEVCPLVPFTYSSTGVSIPNSPVAGEYAIDFDPVPGSGAGGPFADGAFVLTLAAPAAGAEGEDVNVSIDNVLTTAGGAPAMTGEWTLTGRVVTAGVSCDSVPPVTVDFLLDGAPGCDPPPVCEAGSVANGDQTVCPGDDVTLSLTGEDFSDAANIILVWLFIDTATADVFVFPLAPTGPETYNFTGDLNAELAAAELDVLPPGDYLGFAGVFDTTLPDGGGYCDFTEEASDFFLTILDGADPTCNPEPECALPYPAVDDASLSAVQNANGSITFSWEGIPGQIGCQVNAVVGDLAAPTAQTSLIVGGPGASSFTAGVGALAPFPFATINFRVRCGCQQNPSVIAGPYSSFVSVFNLPPALVEGNQGISEKTLVSERTNEGTLASARADVLNLPKYAGMVANSLPGMTEVSRATVTTERNSFDLYPNPSNGAINVTYASSVEGMVNVRVFDLVGKAVADYNFSVNEGENFINLDLSSLEKGLYVVEVLQGETSSTAKVILK